MNLKKTFLILLAAGLTAAMAQQPGSARRIALFVQNHTPPGGNIPMMALTDALTAKLSGRGFQVINPYNAVGVDQNRSVQGEATPAVSALELARQLGADGAVTASVLEIQDSTLGTPPTLHQYSVRLSFSLMDTRTGSAICGETIKRKSPKYTNSQVAQNELEYLGDLLYAAAEECAQRLEDKANAANWQLPLPLPAGEQPSGMPTMGESPAPGFGALLRPPAPPSTILDRKVDALVKEMLLNPQFLKNYEESKARQEGGLPIAVLGGIENKSGNPALDALIEAGGERFRVWLFNSKLFEVKDDGMLVTLGKRIVANGNSALENGELMAALKQHGSPEYFVAGDLKLLTDLDGVNYYKLRLALHSLATGKIVWEGIETFAGQN